MRTAGVTDLVKDTACPKCGGTVWIVDTADGYAPYWLLCIGVNCVETKPIPDDLTIEEED